jgi:hypothetical protein
LTKINRRGILFTKEKSMKRFFCAVLACVGLSPLFLACVGLSPSVAGGGSQQQTQEPSAGSAVSNGPSGETENEDFAEKNNVEITVSEEIRMPLTISILQRLKSEDISKFQLINLGQMSLEREKYLEPNATIIEGKGEGVVKFENIHTSDIITLKDQTDGMALERKDTDGEVVLFVCFEESNEHKLKFSAKKDDPDGYFYLKKDNSEGIPLSEEEKGVVEYGGEQYKVKYNGEKGPFLLIRFIQEYRDEPKRRTMEGRIVE